MQGRYRTTYSYKITEKIVYIIYNEILKKEAPSMRKYFVTTNENTEDNGDTRMVSPSICHA